MSDHHTALGALLRRHLHCPSCVMPIDLFGAPPGSQAIARRGLPSEEHQARVPDCGVRFSVDPENFADVVARKHAPPPDAIEAQARTMVADAPGKYLSALAAVKQTVERRVDEERRRIVDLHREGVQAAKPRKRPIRFPQHLAQRRISQEAVDEALNNPTTSGGTS